jgi:hypothetical protein
MSDLSIIEKTYDLIKWYVPIINRLPKNYKFLLGDRITTGLYDILDGLLTARYSSEKLLQLVVGWVEVTKPNTCIKF